MILSKLLGWRSRKPSSYRRCRRRHHKKHPAVHVVLSAFLFQRSCLVHEIFKFFFSLHDSFGSYGTVAFKNVLSFVVKGGASEHCSRKRIYLLSVRMNKAFHHLAAVLEWAPDETPPSLAPRSPVRGGCTSLSLVQNVEKKSQNAAGAFFFLSHLRFSLAVALLKVFFTVRWWPIGKVFHWVTNSVSWRSCVSAVTQHGLKWMN